MIQKFSASFVQNVIVKLIGNFVVAFAFMFSDIFR